MVPAKKGNAVKIHCLEKLDDGTIFFNFDNQDPMELTIGD